MCKEGAIGGKVGNGGGRSRDGGVEEMVPNVPLYADFGLVRFLWHKRRLKLMVENVAQAVATSTKGYKRWLKRWLNRRNRMGMLESREL